MLYKIRFVFFRHIRYWGCKLLFINAVQYIFILLVPIRFVLGVVDEERLLISCINKNTLYYA